MKKTLRISLSILTPLVLNIIFIMYTINSQMACERYVYGYETAIRDAIFYLSWILFQAIIIIIILRKSKNKRQLLGLPITSFLFAVLYIIMSTAAINYEPTEFNRKEWIKGDNNYYNRVIYVEDIIKNKKLNDKCYDEIIYMLGTPNSKTEKLLEYTFGTGKLKIFLNDSCFQETEVDCNY